MLLTFFLGLSANYLVKLERFQNELDYLSSFPSELNAWYNKYSRVQTESTRLREQLARLQIVTNNRIQELDNNIDRLVWICYNLKEQLKAKSIIFGFSYYSYNY